jgi:hypothetical protein
LVWYGDFPLPCLLMDKHEMLGLAAILMVAAGTWLRWRLVAYCEDAEEGIKEKKITPAQAHRRITVIRWGVPVITIFGLVLLLEAYLRWFTLDWMSRG